MRSTLVAMLMACACLTSPALADDHPIAGEQPVPSAALAPAALTLVAQTTIPEDLELEIADVPGGRAALLCLALNDYWEARGEVKTGRVAVAKVVLNRVRDDRYPSDVCSVVTENKTTLENACQFSWHCDGRPDVPGEAMAWRRSLLLAAAMLYAGDTIDDPSEGALWYHATSVEPDWSSRLDVVRKIGNHIFYRDRSAPVERKPVQVAGETPSASPRTSQRESEPSVVEQESDARRQLASAEPL